MGAWAVLEVFTALVRAAAAGWCGLPARVTEVVWEANGGGGLVSEANWTVDIGEEALSLVSRGLATEVGGDLDLV